MDSQRCSGPEFLIVDGAGARQDHRLGLERRAGPRLHGPQSQEPVCPCPRAAAWRDHRSFQRHDLRDNTRGNRNSPRGLHPQMEAQASRRCRQPGGGGRTLVHLHASAAEPTAQSAHHQRNRAAARGVQAKDHDPKPCCRQPTPLPCCSGHCSPAVRSASARLMVGRRSPQNPSISRLTSPPETIPSCYWRMRHTEFQPHRRHHCGRD